jgi:hypothetical protein
MKIINPLYRLHRAFNIASQVHHIAISVALSTLVLDLT